MRQAQATANGATLRRPRDLAPLIAMMALFFLVVCAVGILRPIKNALALDGLGATDFYKVYLVSAVVVLFVPLYNRLADRFAWRWLIPGVALFFTLNLLLFRVFYVEGSTFFGLVFYGWYDLFAAALVTQFFMATQLFLNARTAKRAYPIIIAGGSIGATLGGAVTGFFAQRVGTPNLLLVAAALIALFSVAMPVVWKAGEAAAEAGRRRGRRAPGKKQRGELRELLRNPHIRMIAGMVLITVLAKQLIDYQFNTLTKEVFQDRDAISAFQGKFNAATQWLPLVALAALQPALRRYGMAVAVLMLPAAMLLTNVGLVLFWGLWSAVAAKGAETSLRYSAERAGREILYVPVAEDVKLRAKAYIDVAVEKGIGKVTSALLIFLLLQFMDYHETVWVGLLLSAGWLLLALRVRREYVRTLARSIEGRFASLRGVFASLLDATTLPVLRRALADADPLRTAFALDLVGQASTTDLRPLAPDLHALLGHAAPAIRARALALLGRVPDDAGTAAIRARLEDAEPTVREAAVRALAPNGVGTPALVEELLGASAPTIRTATLACLARGELGTDARNVARRIYAARSAPADRHDTEARVELALAAGTLGDDSAAARLVPFLEDADARVASTALHSAGLLRDPALYAHMLAGLARPATREAARDAFAQQGEAAVVFLAARLLDPGTDARIRRSIPSVLARVPGERTVAALLRSVIAPETDQLLDYRTIKALGKLRARHPELRFDGAAVAALAAREVAAAERYADALEAVPAAAEGAIGALLRRALLEAWHERRETTFRVLGLVHPQEETYRCYMAVTGGDAVSVANALEWLESTLGYTTFRQLAPVLADPVESGRRAQATAALAGLTQDEDAWIAHCARRANGAVPQGSNTMDLIEKVFLLQNVDLLRDARTDHLASLASIAEEMEAAPGTALLQEGQPTDALYVVVQGSVELRGMGGTLLATDGAAFGTWALIDQSPSVVEARVSAPTRLLRISREDFHDLIGDRPELAIGLLQGLARRVRTLVA